MGIGSILVHLRIIIIIIIFISFGCVSWHLSRSEILALHSLLVKAEIQCITVSISLQICFSIDLEFARFSSTVNVVDFLFIYFWVSSSNFGIDLVLLFG